MFQRHKIVIGVHGNGLTHLVCMKLPSLVIILVPDVRDIRTRKEVPGYMTNKFNEKYSMGYGALATIFSIKSYVIETERDSNARTHWMQSNVKLNESVAKKIANTCKIFLSG